ncbi:MAG: glycosyltransferase family 9 protein [Chloroflexi bacterium]|nr:glycosyltransferase family 9 protein [Chloroflexota bacterium]
MLIAIIRAGALGDFLLGVPALRALRAHFPGAKLHLVGPWPQAGWIAETALVASAISVDAPERAPLFLDSDLPSERGKLAAATPPAPAEHADLASADLAIVWLRRHECVAANLRRLGVARVLAAPPFPLPGERIHVADWLLQTLEPLGVAPPPDWDRYPWLETTSEAREWAAAWCAAHLGDEQFVVLHAGSGSARKNWPASRWTEVVRVLRARDRLPFVLTAGPADDDAVAAMQHALREAGSGADALCTGLALGRLAALLQRATLCLGNDSGVTHLAAGLATPTVAVFGPTDPTIWGPRGPRVRTLGGVVQHERSAATPIASVATWPQPDEAIAAAEGLLRRGRARRST